MIVNIKKAGIKLVYPEGYMPFRQKKLLKQIKGNLEGMEAYHKRTSNAYCVITSFITSAENAMDFDDTQGLIDVIHNNLSEKQGLIEVDSGVTERGYRFIYSIVKTINADENTPGASYFLRMDLESEGKIVEIHGEFIEDGMTGMRDSLGYNIAKSAGMVGGDSSGDLFKGWFKDPYDPSYTKGIPMNLSEVDALDGLFWDHPLSQAREFVHTIIFDELMLNPNIDNIDYNSEVNDPQKEDISKEDLKSENDGSDIAQSIFNGKASRRFIPQKVSVEHEKITPKQRKSIDLGKSIKSGADVVSKKAKDVAQSIDASAKDTAERIKDSKLAEGISQAGKAVSVAAVTAAKATSDAAIKVGTRVADRVEETTEKIKEKKDSEGKTKEQSLDDQLKASVTEYNSVYTSLNDNGTKLFNQRERSIDLLDNVENLIKYSLQGTTQGRYLTGGVPPVRFSM